MARSVEEEWGGWAVFANWLVRLFTARLWSTALTSLPWCPVVYLNGQPQWIRQTVLTALLCKFPGIFRNGPFHYSFFIPVSGTLNKPRHALFTIRADIVEQRLMLKCCLTFNKLARLFDGQHLVSCFPPWGHLYGRLWLGPLIIRL